MMHLRRGITLVEILVSLVILGIVAAMVSVEFLAQNRSWKTESDKASVGMMAKGALDEISHSARLTGGGLPPLTGGILTHGIGPARVTFVTNETGYVGVVPGTSVASSYDPTTASLRIAVDTAKNFPDQGYARLSLNVPVSTSLPPGHTNPGAQTTQFWTLGIKERVVMAGTCGSDSLVLDATPLINNSWNNTNDIQAMGGVAVYRLDSISYFKSNDTLFIKRNWQDSMVNALGVDTLILLYHHPADNTWMPTVVAPDNTIDQVKIHLVTRSLRPDPHLAEQDSTTGGYHFSTLEAEVTLRNDKLLNF